MSSQGDSYRITRVVRSAILTMFLVATTVMVAPAPPASASVSSHDAELIGLINMHRGSIGLDPLLEYAPLSTAALDWALRMRNGSSSPCGREHFFHDSFSNVQRQGTPPGTSQAGENINWSCAPTGLSLWATDNGTASSSPRWTYGAMPAVCNVERIDWTSALFGFCEWMNSDGHRANIERADFTHIGSGTVTYAGGSGNTGTYTTHRFAGVSLAVEHCAGIEVTVNLANGDTPTNGHDVILGTEGNDIINARAGDDLICGLGGDDTIKGGPGRDTIFAGLGADTVFGGGGDDTIYGQGGNDELKGQGGSDVVDGGDNDDLVEGSGAPDTLFGGAGDDEIIGGNGADVMYGGEGNDLIKGVLGPDAVIGGGGDDQLFGGNGNDDLRGGANNDRCAGNLGGNDAAEINTCELRLGVESVY